MNASYPALLLVRLAVGGTMIAHVLVLSVACLALAVLGPGRFPVDSASGGSGGSGGSEAEA